MDRQAEGSRTLEMWKWYRVWGHPGLHEIQSQRNIGK